MHQGVRHLSDRWPAPKGGRGDSRVGLPAIFCDFALSGAWWVNSGADFDPDRTVPVPAGGFRRRVAHTPHYDGARRDGKEPAVIAIFGIAGRLRAGGRDEARLAAGVTGILPASPALRPLPGMLQACRVQPTAGRPMSHDAPEADAAQNSPRSPHPDRRAVLMAGAALSALAGGALVPGSAGAQGASDGGWRRPDG